MKKNGRSNALRRSRSRIARRFGNVSVVTLVMALAIAGASIGNAPPVGRAKALDNLLFEPGRGVNLLGGGFSALGPVAPFKIGRAHV